MDGSTCYLCSHAILHCSTCSNSTTCTSCTDNYVAISGSASSCSACDPSCDICNNAIDFCLTCSASDEVANNLGVCKTCDGHIEGCTACDDYATCTACDTDGKTLGGAKYSLHNDMCCKYPCLTCSDATTCVSNSCVTSPNRKADCSCNDNYYDDGS